MDIFRENIRKYIAEIAGLSKILGRISVLRIIVFISGVVLTIYLANLRLIGWMALAFLIFLMVFIFLVITYNKYSFRRRHAVFLKEINESEILRIENKLSGFPEGKNFEIRNHSYCGDLDIFGKHSVFQLLNRTTTETGRAKLAEWLTSPADPPTIIERQAAVRELMPSLEWRQDLQASGMHFSNKKSDFNKLLDWIKKPNRLLPSRVTYLTLAIILGLLTITTFVLWVVYLPTPEARLYLTALIILGLLNAVVLMVTNRSVEEVINDLYQNMKTMEAYRSLIVKIETQNFQSPLLRALRQIFITKEYSASKEIGKFIKIMDLFLERGLKKEPVSSNVFYWIFNFIILLDIHCVLMTERWRKKNKDLLSRWSDAVSEFEVINSMSGFAYAHPAYVFPEISESPFNIKFRNVGHPLIPDDKRICNDFNLEGRGKIAMITGSNMSGKSTFLRTVGVNLVLAYAGAPCCAGFCHLSLMKIFTSMRTQDNLEEGISSFYAELKRVEQLLKLIEEGEPIFFLLDEMFKGTNSEDRHKGGYSLIRQMGELNAFGIISTHDLELAKIMDHRSGVFNYSFNSIIRADEIIFDYKLTNEICKDFNASELMRKSGIKILPEIPPGKK